jgi:transposase-like protein
MTLTTPAQERYTQFSCPNPPCARCNRPGAGNIAHRSWTGMHKHIERLRCTACDREFSEREGPLMARSKLSEDTVERLLKCQRWGVCDAGTADICAVDLKTVYRFQRVATQRAQTHHQQVVRDVDVPGVQLDEAHSKLRPKQVEWVHTALAMGSGFLLWVDFGPRTQDTAATLLAQVVARTRQLPLVLTDGRRIPRRCSRSWASSIVPAGVGKSGAGRSPDSSRPKTCSTPRWSRGATRRARWWRSAPG